MPYKKGNKRKVLAPISFRLSIWNSSVLCLPTIRPVFFDPPPLSPGYLGGRFRKISETGAPDTARNDFFAYASIPYSAQSDEFHCRRLTRDRVGAVQLPASRIISP